MEEEEAVHVLLITFPSQGLLNPMLRSAKRLAAKGLFVTYAATQVVAHKMKAATDRTTANTPTSIGKGQLRFDFFSDGWDIDDPRRNEYETWMEQFIKVGPEAVTDLITRQAADGRPVSFVINNPFMPWVLDIATDMGIPCGMQWVQSCAVFSAYYHYCHGSVKFPSSVGSNVRVELAGMPVLSPSDLPSYLLENSPYMGITNSILDQFKNMSKASWVLVDSFEELEKPVCESIAGLAPIKPIGPLFKSIDGVDSSSVKTDMWRASDCLDWLDSHPPTSVIYVSFGSVVVLDSKQMEEIAWAIRNSGVPFLWVVKPKENSTETGLPKGFLEETMEKGKVVKWSPQEEVLSHPSVACFLTHCGWNSSTESICCGVPTIGFPQWGDQMTNAKFLQDVFGTGMRLIHEDQSLVLREEVEKCIGEMMGSGDRVMKMKKNALKWKEEAAKAVAEGGSSYRNLETVVEDIKRRAANFPKQSIV